MRKSIKKVAASLMAATMVLGTMSMAFADGEESSVSEFTADDCADAVHYTIPGGINDWNPKNKDNELTATAWDGVYSKTVNFPAYDSEAENLSRFKITQIDDITVETNGWPLQLCLGTTTFNDNQSAIRVESESALENATIYFDVNTGAVVILDSEGNDVDYNFSWVGADGEAQYTTVSGFATCGYTWPSDKVMTDAPSDLAEQHAALLAKVKGTDLADYDGDTVIYTMAGGSSPVAWAPLSSANELKETEKSGVYSIDVHFPAFSEDSEWLNRFKICGIDDMTSTFNNGWAGSICLGTGKYEDNQTTFRALNTEDVDATIFYYPENGAVVIRDDKGNDVPYEFSWVGYDNELQYTTVAEFATAGIVWPSDKVKYDEPKDLAERIQALNDILDGKVVPVTENPSPAASEDPSPTASGDSSPAASENTTTAAPAATNAPTTASNQSTKTGDVAPVAILSLLVAAVAVVTVAAKKREA